MKKLCMQKRNFAATILSAAGGVLLFLGICMCLLPRWNTFALGLIMGGIGSLVLLVMAPVWRGMENTTPIRLNARTVGLTLMGVTGAMGLGACMVMAWIPWMLATIISAAM